MTLNKTNSYFPHLCHRYVMLSSCLIVHICRTCLCLNSSSFMHRSTFMSVVRLHVHPRASGKYELSFRAESSWRLRSQCWFQTTQSRKWFHQQKTNYFPFSFSCNTCSVKCVWGTTDSVIKIRFMIDAVWFLDQVLQQVLVSVLVHWNDCLQPAATLTLWNQHGRLNKWIN